MTGTDLAESLRETVTRAFEAGEGLRIVGSGSKGFLSRGVADAAGGPPSRLLSVAEHSGVTDYRPEELVITARAGTPLRELARVLAQQDQHLPFEPPAFRGGGTLGGAVASGLSGPGRPWWGSLRDALLGVELLNGRGERLRFGGQVMKNVAGYDVSRLQAGAFGTLGVLLSLSVKVLPRPPAQSTRVLALPAEQALAHCREWARRPLPVSATCYLDGLLRVRLSGAEAAVTEAAAELGGEVERDDTFWALLRDHRVDFLAGTGTSAPLWRCVVPPASRVPMEGCLVTWAGGERWWRTTLEPQEVMSRAAAQGGYARPFDGTYGLPAGPWVSGTQARYAARLKHAFDPGRVLNPELSPELSAELSPELSPEPHDAH